jgi:hypothetical protein
MSDITGETLAEMNRAGITYTELAGRYGLTKGQVARRIQNVRTRTDQGKERRRLFDWNFGEPLSLSGDFMVIGDVHVPATDWDFAMLVTRIAQKRGIKQLIVAGDFLNMDFLSQFSTPVKLPGWQDERDAAREFALSVVIKKL